MEIKDISEELRSVGLDVERLGDCYYACWTERGHLLLVDRAFDELLEREAWRLFSSGAPRHANCFDEEKDLIAALRSYLGR